MPQSLEPLFAERGAARNRSTLAFGVLASVAVWFADAFIDGVLLEDRGFFEEAFRPTGLELWIRFLISACAIMLYRAALDRRRHRLLHAALTAAADGIQITTLDGRIGYSNRAVKTLYGWEPAELQGRHVNELNADPTFASREILPAIQRDGAWQGELYVKHRDGHVFPIWLTTSLVTGPRGRPIAAIGVIRDVSERKRAEQALRDNARRLEEATTLKDLFADILRHDLLGPASTVQLSLDSLLKRDPEPASRRRILETARRSNSRLIDMIEGAARYARLSAHPKLDFQAVDLGVVLAEVIADFELRRKERGTILDLRTPGAFPARAHPLVREVFENLVSNAIKYGPEGGTVHVDVADDGDRWTVAVTDHGEGILDADKEKVFVRFERLRKEGVKGTGLGLAIAKRIVDLHGGRIWVEDVPGGGASFRVSLAKAAPGAPAAAPAPPASPPPVTAA